MEDLLKELTETFGPSGSETVIGALIEKKISDRVDHLFYDNLGNLIAVRNGPSPRIMLSAHMDEIGVVVTHVDETGFLRLAPVGGIAPQFLPGQRLQFQSGAKGTVYHEKLKNLKELNWAKLFLDLGATGQEDAVSMVRIGDTACFDQPFVKLGRRYLAKAMDNRAGCALLIEVLQRLPDMLPQELCFVFSVQEEVGLRGARTAAFHLKPDFGLAVDVTRVGDTPKAPLMAVSLGKGPAVKVKDSSVICHPQVRELMIRTAEEAGIPYQLEVLERGGTDAGAIHLSREGVPSGVLSLPCRYIHTASEIIDRNDLHYGADLLEKLCLVHWGELKQ